MLNPGKKDLVPEPLRHCVIGYSMKKTNFQVAKGPPSVTKGSPLTKGSPPAFCEKEDIT